MKWILFLLLTSFFAYSCSTKKSPIKQGYKPTNTNLVDSIIKTSDSTYTKPYGRTDFVTAVYYINKKDKTVSQLMKDSSGNIRQIIISKNNVRSFFAQYYPNGQLQATIPLDEQGQNNGHSIYYYEDGSVESEGEYLHGFHTGTWKNYDSTGKATAVDMYDSNGARKIK